MCFVLQPAFDIPAVDTILQVPNKVHSLKLILGVRKVSGNDKHYWLLLSLCR